ncbi:NAD-P-binding protein [Stereum hirsutum FP-91666 SS1]|uniref:NAD-P-binding protein n=1 Tax=Stereum hirsutum (strain FP-91666) TaxID=721885 RepID=UPI0004410477|nr:NAD-P-binding protein [Stereum hirsutum FP-91666 SS1]EIM90352.1 NAD-P-binding protein [Stereum hirsutum FP-91666 SS1]
MSTIKFDGQSTAESVAHVLSDKIVGKTVIITGVSPKGIGAEAARAFAKAGAKVVLSGRNQSKLQETADAIKKETPGADIRELILDLGSQKSVRKAADEVLKYSGPVDALILNAGVMGTPWEKTEDGIEKQFATNHVGNFLFTNLIIPKLLEAPSPRVLAVSSVGHFWGQVRFEDYNFEDGKVYDKWEAYGQSKTAVILFAVELAERFKDTKLVVFSCHPGGAATGLARHMTKEDLEKFADYFNPDGTPKGNWLKTVGECAANYLVAGFDPSIADKSGSYLTDCQVANEQAAPYALDKDSAKKLWDLSEKLVGQKFPA